MLELSFWEIFVVVVACILFIKPEDIPDILRQLGKFFAKIRKIAKEYASLLEVEDEAAIKPKNKILGLDGKYHDAYDVKEVFPEEVRKEDGQQQK